MLRGVAPNSGDSGKPRLSGLPLLAAALGVVLAVQALFVLSYVGALHHPKPHDVAFGVVGNSRLPLAVGKQFSLKVRQYPDEAAARSAIDHRRIDGAFVADSGGGTLLVVPAASNAGATALGTAFGAAAAALEQKLTVVQVHTLPTGDASGNVSFLVVMALIVGGYLASTIGMVFGGSATAPRPTRFPGPGLRARSAAHRRVRRPCPRRRSDVEVPRALGPVRARDDGSRLRDRRPPDRARARGDADRGRPLHRLRRAGLGRHRSVGVPSRPSGEPSAHTCRPVPVRPPSGTRSTSTGTRSPSPS